MNTANRWWVAFVWVLALSACSEDSKPSPQAAGEGDPNRGRQVYLAQCVACHNTDPAKVGPLGPAVRGASHELLESRLLRASYPPGYTPKRNTALMPPQPHLEPSIPDLAAFLK